MKLFWENKNFHHNDRQCPFNKEGSWGDNRYHIKLVFPAFCFFRNICLIVSEYLKICHGSHFYWLIPYCLMCHLRIYMETFHYFSTPVIQTYFWKPQLGHFLFFLCFASVQNYETYPPARGENKQALKNNVVSACCMDVKYNKNYLFLFLCKRNPQQSVK
jgi:hypothetical protein